MRSEAIDIEALEAWPFGLAAISYLERNDFTEISQIGLRLLCAKDGARPVFVWITVAVPFAPELEPSVTVPTRIFDAAELVKARLDVIVVQAAVPGGVLVMRHLMNVGGA